MSRGPSSYGTSSSAPSRVIRLRSENDDELLIEENANEGCRPITVSTSSGGVVVGCTRLSWKAWDYIMREVQSKR
jgi:hypothetical protein